MIKEVVIDLGDLLDDGANGTEAGVEGDEDETKDEGHQAPITGFRLAGAT